MTERREILMAVLGVLALGAPLHADMMPVSPSDAGYRPSPPGDVAAASQEVDFSAPFAGGIADFASLPVASLPVSSDDATPAREMQAPVPVLTDGQNSFSLCLCTLLGLGLCKSVPLVKKLHFGAIPEWYHEGGPSQVGHSLAISPDCLCAAPACFVQPQCPAEEHIPHYFFATVVSHWRNAQFTPAVLASRAPPSL
jgi:hypothetical protein